MLFVPFVIALVACITALRKQENCSLALFGLAAIGELILIIVNATDPINAVF
ncbi:hypothetical protein ACPUER_29460 [Burkholderia sp. DN3021]|uniref:hypothetical protein n=1 Tax=Burkholderia sp. DN3021 TaxID=3410137 RepID=UPI003C7A3AA8